MNPSQTDYPLRIFDRHIAMGDALWTQAIYDRIVYDLAVGGERL